MTAVASGSMFGGQGGAAAAASARRRRRCRRWTRIRWRSARRRMTIPANARISEPYWHRAGDAGRYTFDADAPFGLPYRPTPFRAQVTLDDRQRR